MIEFSKKDKNELKKMDILAVYFFGSRAREENIHSLSDFDFGVIFKNFNDNKHNTLEIYGKLYDIIIDILPKNYLKKRFEMNTHEVDIVFLQIAPISMQAKVIQESKILFEDNRTERNKYEEYVLERYCDLKYAYDLSRKYLLQRL